MRRVVSNNEVPHLWAHQSQTEAKNGNGSFYFAEKTIYSYGAHFPIATFVENAHGQTAILFTTRTHSVTTAHHCSEVRRAIHHIPQVFDVPLGPRMFGYGNDSQSIVENHRATMLSSYAERIQEQSQKVARARNHKDWQFDSLCSLVAQANRFCEFFGLPERFTAPSDFDALRSQLAKVAAEKAKADKERKRRIAAENAERVAQWIAGENVIFPYSVDTVYLRIEGRDVVTSRGARFPVEHAAKGLAFVRAIKQAGKEYRRNGHTFHLGPYAIDRIDIHGNVQAGCHVVTYSEIERIALQLEAICK